MTPEDKAPDMRDDNCDCYFTARFKIKNAIDDEALNSEFGGDMLKFVKCVLADEHVSCVAEDDYEILEASRTLPAQSPDQGAVNPSVWKDEALTLAHNIITQEIDRINADDGSTEAMNALMECQRRIKGFIGSDWK